jgi:hypothetical protein
MQRNKQTTQASLLSQAKTAMDAASNHVDAVEEAHVRSMGILQGFRYSLQLSPLIAMRPDADIFERLLNELNLASFFESKTQDTKVLPKLLTVEEYEKLHKDSDLKPYLTKYFERLSDVPRGRTLHGRRLYYPFTTLGPCYRWKWHEAFTIKCTRVYHSHAGMYGIRYADSTSRRALADAESAFEALGGWSAWSKTRQGHVSPYDYENVISAHEAKLQRQALLTPSSYSNCQKALRSPVVYTPADDTSADIAIDDPAVVIPPLHPLRVHVAPIASAAGLH